MSDQTFSTAEAGENKITETAANADPAPVSETGSGSVPLSAFYGSKRYNYRAKTNALQLLLMPFVFFVLLGFPGKYGAFVSLYSNFVAQAFFIIFGFFTLVPSRRRRMRKVRDGLRRSFKLFAIMFVAYIVMNAIYIKVYDFLPDMLSETYLRKRVFFEFLVLNVWPFPIGNGIWFIQSLFYAYVFFLFAEKTKVHKAYLPILILLILLMLFTGEFSAFIGVPFFGYPYIPANAVTRAIPYMLIGMYLRKGIDRLAKIPRYVYLIMVPVGLLAALAEIELLGFFRKLIYPGHTIGFGITAIALCCFVLVKPDVKENFFTKHGRSYARRMYAFAQPVSFAAWAAAALLKPAYLGIVKDYSCFISLIVCFVLSYLITFIKRKAFSKHGGIIRRMRKILKKIS